MRTILVFVGLLTLLGAALDQMADMSVGWDQKRQAMQEMAIASGTEQFLAEDQGYGAKRVHVLPGQREYASGAIQHDLRVERTQRLLAGLPINPTAESDGKWVRNDGLVPAWHGPH